MKLRRMKMFLSLVLTTTAVVVAFNNCSGVHTNNVSNALSLSYQWTCSDNLDDLTLFGLTYHPFLMNNCASCHSGGGPGPGAFASSAVQAAFTSFDALGFSRINSRATDGHSSGSGAHHRPTIEALTASYVAGLETIETCAGGVPNENQDSEERIAFISKAINPNLNQPVTVTWNLQNDARPPAGSSFNPADFAGMQLSVTVQIFQRPGIVSYVVSNPRIITSSGDVHVESLLFKLNGQATPAQRAFYLVKSDIRAWNSSHPDFGKPDPNSNTPYNDYQYQAQLVSGGSLVMPGEVRTTDVLSVSIARLERVTLPPPDLGPRVQFGVAAMSVNEDYRIVNIPLTLDRPSTGVRYAQVTFGPDTTVKDQCCRTIRNDNGMNIRIDHFDRDIQDYESDRALSLNLRQAYNGEVINNVAQTGRFLVSFKDGETTAYIRIKVVEDDRDEPNEVLHLRIDPFGLTGLQAGTTNQDFRLTIVDDDAPYTGNPETYTDLLSDGGLLADQCLRCHNSVDRRGGYDMTNYEMLLARRILIPGAPTDSWMFRRMDANIPGLLPMPLTGLLEPNDRQRVANWILIGAPNN